MMPRWKMKRIWLNEKYLDLFERLRGEILKMIHQFDYQPYLRRNCWKCLGVEFLMCLLVEFGPSNAYYRKRTHLLESRTKRIEGPNGRTTTRGYPITWLNRIKYKDLEKQPKPY